MCVLNVNGVVKMNNKAKLDALRQRLAYLRSIPTQFLPKSYQQANESEIRSIEARIRIIEKNDHDAKLDRNSRD